MNQHELFLFRNESGGQFTWSIRDILTRGNPVDPDTGEELIYVGPLSVEKTYIPTKMIASAIVIDPDTGLRVEVEIRKLHTGGMVGLDASYLEQLADGEHPVSPYDDGSVYLHVPDDEYHR